MRKLILSLLALLALSSPAYAERVRDLGAFQGDSAGFRSGGFTRATGLSPTACSLPLPN